MQLNLQHSRVATANLTQIILQYNIGVPFVQEPYTILNKVAGFPKGFKIFTRRSGRKRSAIIVNNDIDVIAITQGSHEDAILTEFIYQGLKFYGASLYIPIDQDIEWDLGTIEEIIRLTKGEMLLLALDKNARSKIWSDTYTNARGRALEEYIITRDLLIMNEDSDVPTFESRRGRSWIDLTLCNSTLAQKIGGWSRGKEVSCADQKIIFFEIDSWANGCKTKQYTAKRYNAKAERWIKHTAKATIYKGAILSLLSYGVPIWIEAMNYEHNRQKYIRVQLINISMAKAYRTTSSKALCMLTGMTPIIIKLEESAQRCKAKERTGNCKIELDHEVKLKNWPHPADAVTIEVVSEEDATISAYTDGSKQDQAVGSGVAIFKGSNMVAQAQLKLDTR